VRKEVPECEFLFVGTKSDVLPSEDHAKIVATAEQQLGDLQPRGVFLTSAMSREGVDDVFKTAAELYTPRQELGALKERAPAKPAGETAPCTC
jgi:hypothetical protein